jgi:predicted ester cyclase
MHHLRELTFLHIEKQERVSYTKTLLLDISSISRFENGKIVEVWGEFDRPGMLQQLGLISTVG